jgi:hypothetical protein
MLIAADPDARPEFASPLDPSPDPTEMIARLLFVGSRVDVYSMV